MRRDKLVTVVGHQFITSVYNTVCVRHRVVRVCQLQRRLVTQSNDMSATVVCGPVFEVRTSTLRRPLIRLRNSLLISIGRSFRDCKVWPVMTIDSFVVCFWSRHMSHVHRQRYL